MTLQRPYARMPKHRNIKVKVREQQFDSKRELHAWMILCDRQRRGEISDLQRQVSFELAPAVDLGEKRMKPPLRYIADFTYQESGALVVADAKGLATAAYRIKKHLMATVHGIVIKEI